MSNQLFKIFYQVKKMTHLVSLDDLSSGDGTEIGNCPSNYPTYNCLSNGACNVCGLISGYAEGCDITSTTPVCDADSTTSISEDSATGKVAHCVKCTKSSMLHC